MSLRISDSPFDSSVKWGVAAAVTLSAVVFANKVYAIFNRSIPNQLERNRSGTLIKLNDADKKLLEVTNNYLAFINRISKGEAFLHNEIAFSLLTPDCRKILNGKVFTRTRDDFISDLLEVQRTRGCWTIKPVKILSSSQNKCVTLRLMIEMDQLGLFTAIVILQFNSSYLITEIDEVFTKADVILIILTGIINETTAIR